MIEMCRDCRDSSSGVCVNHSRTFSVNLPVGRVVDLGEREENIKALRGKYKNVELRVGQRSIENLSHFNCPDCLKWFSVSDAPTDKTQWACPWCFEVNEYENK